LYNIFIRRTSWKHNINKVNKKTGERKRKQLLGIAKCKGKILERKRRKESN